LCSRLKKEGEDVPDEGEKDISAPGSYKPPGLRAAKTRDLAKIELEKKKSLYEKTAKPSAAKEERLQALKEKLKEIEKEQEEAQESIKQAKKAGKK